MGWNRIDAAVTIQKIARGHAARREWRRKKLHTVAGEMLLDLLETTRFEAESVAKNARVSKDLDGIPGLAAMTTPYNDKEIRVKAVQDIAFVLCEVRGENEGKAFQLLKTTGIADILAPFAKDCLSPPETRVLYPIYAIMANLPSLGGEEGEDILLKSGGFEFLIDSLYSKDPGAQYYAVAGVSNMSHNVKAVTMVKDRKAQKQLESLLDSNNRHIINFAIKALENVTEVQGAFDFLFFTKKKEIEDRKERIELARQRYQRLTDADTQKRFAASQIQKWVRGRLVRRTMSNAIDEKADMVRAAIRIQACARGRMTRTKTSELLKRHRSLRMRAGVSKVSTVNPKLKKRVKSNRAQALASGGSNRLGRVKALVAKLNSHDGINCHVAAVLDATMEELDYLEAHAAEPDTEVLAILERLEARYALACAGGGPSGQARLERVQPLVAKYEKHLPHLALHAAVFLFASKKEVVFLEEARDADPAAWATVEKVSARYQVVSAMGTAVDGALYERVQQLAAKFEGEVDAHAGVFLFASEEELARLDELPAVSADAHAIVRDLALRWDLAEAASGGGSSRMERVASLRGGQELAPGLSPALLLVATQAELKALSRAAKGGSFADDASTMLEDLEARYNLVFNAHAIEAAGGAGAGSTRANLAAAIAAKYEEAPGVVVHAATLLFATRPELSRLLEAEWAPGPAGAAPSGSPGHKGAASKEREAPPKDVVTILTDVRIRHELALATVDGHLKRIDRAQALFFKFEDVPFVHAGIFLLASKPELKQLEGVKSSHDEGAFDLLELLRAKHERAAAAFVQQKRQRQAEASDKVAHDARAYKGAKDVRPALERNVQQHKQERQDALHKAQRVFPVYNKAGERLASNVAPKREAATVMQARVRGQQARSLADGKKQRQDRLHAAGAAGGAAKKAARTMHASAEQRIAAAIFIQRVWRGYSARKVYVVRHANRARIESFTRTTHALQRVPPVFDAALRKRQAAARTIQRHLRGLAARRYAAHKREVLEEMGDLSHLYPVIHTAKSALLWLSREKHYAAITIQRFWRGARAAGCEGGLWAKGSCQPPPTRYLRDSPPRFTPFPPNRPPLGPLPSPRAPQASPRASARASSSPRWAASTAGARNGSTSCRWTRTCFASTTAASRGIPCTGCPPWTSSPSSASDPPRPPPPSRAHPPWLPPSARAARPGGRLPPTPLRAQPSRRPTTISAPTRRCRAPCAQTSPTIPVAPTYRRCTHSRPRRPSAT